MMKVLLNLLLGLVLLAYPFLVFWGLTRFQPRILALMIAAVFLLRWFLGGSRGFSAGRSLLPIAGAVSVTVLLVLLFGNSRLLLINPVLINLVFLITFGLTLKKPPSMIERFARLRESELPPQAVPYCRKVTMVWCVFFLINGGIALWTATMSSLQIWTIYNGLISYFLMGALFLGEWLVRQVHLRGAGAGKKNGNPLA